MAAYDRCPICKYDFQWCDHTIPQADRYVADRNTDKGSRKVILSILKEFNLIPPDAK
jgi:hypothetical protein